MTDDNLLTACLRLGTATLHEAAGGRGALPLDIRPVHPADVAGWALPVRCAPGDNLALHEALAAAEAGEVIVATCGTGLAHGYWGEVMAVAAQARGVRGLVIDGSVRDTRRLAEIGFPAFSRGVCVRGTGKDTERPRSVGSPIVVGDCTVVRGDLVVGDADGVLVLPRADVADVVAAGLRREDREREQFARLRAGELTLDLLGLREQVAAP